MKYIKENWKFYLFIITTCIIGGYFTTLYSLEFLDQSIVEEGIRQVGTRDLLVIISALQISVYAIIFTSIGIILANKIGLWKKVEKNKAAIKKAIIISIIGGLVLSILDRYVFGSLIDQVRYSYDNKPTMTYIITSFTYGGVFEEVLMRLFLMSLLSWVIFKIFYKKEQQVPTKAFVVANIISALLFALGHLPSTNFLFGYIDGWILFRCILLNGGLGLAFGWLYRKYGIAYSMLAHFGAHLISKIIWIIFI